MKINRHIQPSIKFLDGLRPEEPRIETLDNGIPVYLINTPGQDILKIELLFEAGKWHEPRPLIASFTNKMLKEGTQNLTSNEVADGIDFYGAHLETAADKDMGYISLYTLNKHLEKTLPIVTDIVMHPIFPTEELETMKQNRKQRFLVNNRKVRFVAKRNFNAAIYGAAHPYGRLFSEENFDDIQRNELIQFHKSYYSSQNCRIIVAGKIGPDLIGLLNKHFLNFNNEQAIPSKDEELNGHPAPDANVRIEKDNAVQSAIRVGRILFNKKHPDYAKMKILNTALGGYFGSRLMTNIREDKGYTYGIGSAVVSFQQAGHFFISSEVGNEVTDDALREVYLEIEKLQQDLIPEEELNLVKNYMLGSFLRSLDGAFSLSENYKGLLEYGLNYQYLQDFVDVIKSVTSAELRELAGKYLSKSDLTQLTVGK